MPSFLCSPRLLVAVVVTGFLQAADLLAQSSAGPLVTDRPDQTESALVVAPGLVQLEVGWTLEQEGRTGIRQRTTAVPQVKARLGLIPGLEGRLGFAGWQGVERRELAGVTSSNGVGDLDVGFKYRAVAAHGSIPDVALIGTLTLPTGNAGFGSPRADPTVLLAFANTLTDRLGVGYNLGASWSTEGATGGQATLLDILYTVSLGVGVAERAGVFIELFGSVATEPDRGNRHTVDGGVTYRVRDNLQFDLSGGLGVNQGAADWFLGAGVAVRLPR
jgi:hypothetical protein